MKGRVDKAGLAITTIAIAIIFSLILGVRSANAQFGYYGGIYGSYGGMLGGLYGSRLYGGGLYGSSLYGGGLYGSSLYGGGLYGSSLYGGGLYGSSLYGGGLYGSNLYGGGMLGSMYGGMYGGMLGGLNNNQGEALQVYNYLQYALNFYNMAKVTPGLYQQDFEADYIGAVMASYAINLNLTPEEAIVYFVGQNYLQNYLP